MSTTTKASNLSRSRLLHPANLLIASAFVWIAILTLTGIRYQIVVPPAGLASLVIGIVAAALGATYAARPTRLKDDARDNFAAGKQVTNAVHVGALIGLASLAIRFALGEATIPGASALQIATTRDPSVDAVSVASIGTPLAPFGLAAFCLMLSIGTQSFSRPTCWLAAASLAQYLLFGLAGGSRTHIAFAFTCILIARGSAPRTNRRRAQTRRRTGVLLLTGIAAILAVSYWLLPGRLAAQGFTATTATSYLQSAHDVVVPDLFKDVIYGGTSWAAGAYVLLSLTHYFAHGVFEFFRLFDWQTTTTPNLTYGTETVGPILAPALNFLGVTPGDPQLAYPVQGVYRTMFGALLVDFGVVGMVVASLLLGLACGAAYRSSCHSQNNFIYAPFAVVLLAAPYFNAIAGAFGLYTIFAFVCLHLLARSRVQTSM